jgi:hypothetical protein
LTNAATQIVFNSSGDDALTMSKNWNDPNVTAQHISELSRYEFYCRTFEDDQPIVRKIKAPAHLQLRFKNERSRSATFAKVVNQSLMRWGVPRSQLRDRVAKVLSS